MDTMAAMGPELLTLALPVLAAGIVAGFLAGLLGIGGGIIIVPALLVALAATDTAGAVTMHVAVATSLATIIPTSLSSSRAHWRRGSVDVELARRWAPAVFLGACAGVLIADRLHSDTLTAIFAVMAVIFGVKMWLPLDDVVLRDGVPRGGPALSLPFSIGALSTLMGIGGGTFGVTALSLFNQAIHRAVGTAALLGFVISLPATVGYVLAGWDEPGRPPFSLGYVNLLAVALIIPATILMAPLGAAVAHRLSRRWLSRLFGVFLVVTGIRLGMEVWPS
ncbi:sulfite exporter TauE/SafE family protein [Lentisalinibacter orientalis]|uniref:sulfite exporter TauE/SafE family protein n=1 Tax=Lentisalinibacter orientalis TaxID=2992241 RepID=UPI00386E9A25